MPPTLRQLDTFLAVARHRNFTRAAEDLALTQPAVSQQIRQLENSVGLPLLEQLGRRIDLTEAGREVLAYAQAIRRQMDEMEGVLDALRGLEKGRLAIAAATAANYFAPHLLGSFQARHPGVTVSLEIANSATVIERLRANDVDMAIMGRPPRDLPVKVATFKDNPLILIAAPSHPLARPHPGHEVAEQRKLPLTRLAGETFLVREAGSGTRAAFQRFFEGHGITVRQGMELGSDEAIKQSVAAGLGLGMMSRGAVEAELIAGRVVELPVEHFPFVRQWNLVHRQGKRLSAPADAFRTHVLAQSGRRRSI
ncbi:LysR family transcriptional regulator [Roseospirillum parvum]|nr:LysR family transcriptional regulator [Roseospirillum parvum]